MRCLAVLLMGVFLQNRRDVISLHYFVVYLGLPSRLYAVLHPFRAMMFLVATVVVDSLICVVKVCELV